MLRYRIFQVARLLRHVAIIFATLPTLGCAENTGKADDAVAGSPALIEFSEFLTISGQKINLKKLVVDLKQSIVEDPADAYAHACLSLALAHCNRFQDAAIHAKIAMELEPLASDGYLAAAENEARKSLDSGSFEVTGEFYKQCKSAIESALARSQSDARLHYHLALLDEFYNNSTAITHAEDACNYDSSNFDYRRLLVRLLIENGQVSRAREVAFSNDQFKLAPEGLMLISDILLNMGDLDSAIKSTREAIVLAPSNDIKAKAFRQLGDIYDHLLSKQGQAKKETIDHCQQAAKAWEGAFRLSPTEELAKRIYIAKSTIREDAEDWREEAIRLSKDVRALRLVGAAKLKPVKGFRQNNKYTWVVKKMKTAGLSDITRNQDFVIANERGQTSHYRVNAFEQAKKLVQDANVSGGGLYTLARYNVAVFMHLNDELEYAKELYREIIDIDPYDIEARNNLAQIQWRMGNQESACETIKAAVSMARLLGIDINFYQGHLEFLMSQSP